MPFGLYKNFADCVRKNASKMHDAKAFCGWLKRKIEGEDPLVLEYVHNYEALYALYRVQFLATHLLGLELLTSEDALAALGGKDIWKDKDNAVVLDDHRWVHMWEKTLKRKQNLFITKKQLKKLHDLIVDELGRRGMDSGLEHKTPIKISIMELGTRLESFLKNRKAFLLNPAFINLIGSSISGKEEPQDLDIMFSTSKTRDYEANLLESLPDAMRSGIDLIFDPTGPNGPYIPAFELWAIPVKNPKPMEPKFNISPLAPIIPAAPKYEIGDPRELLEDSYYVASSLGIRLMIHRKESHIIAFDSKLEEVDIPDQVAEALLGIKEPRTFILDGFLTREKGRPLYYLLDLPWWRDSEHISQSVADRRVFLSKLPLSDTIKLAPVKYFENRRDTIDYLKGEKGPYILIPGTTGYPVDGQAEWYLYRQSVDLMRLAESSDAQIRTLVNSGKWEGMPADQRFSLMTKREEVEPLYPFAQLKTTKKGYSAREVFGLPSVDQLAKELFKVPGKQAIEVKIDGFRGQVHKKGDQVRIFTESGHDITKQLPSIVADAKRTPGDSFVVDSEITPYGEDLSNLGRAGAAPAFAKGAKGPVDDSLWAIHVFDVLYIDGEQLHSLPYAKRRERLHGLEFPVRDNPKSKSDFKFHIWENKVNWATSAEQMTKMAEEASAVPGSEGAMFKQAESKYRLSGNTPLWSKMKAAFEVDAIVVGVVKKGSSFNYIGAVGPIGGHEQEAEEAPLDSPKGKKFVKWKGKIYSVLGRTFNTKMEAKVGDIIRVSVKDMREIASDVYHWFHPQVLEKREDKTRPDPVQTARTISQTAKKKRSAIAWDIVKGELVVAGGPPSESYLVNARFDFHSPLASYNAPWIAVPLAGVKRIHGNCKNFKDGRCLLKNISVDAHDPACPDFKSRTTKSQWTYLRNDKGVYSKLRDIGVDLIIGTEMQRELLEKMIEAGIDFKPTYLETIADIPAKPVWSEPYMPDEIKINYLELKAFYDSIRSEPIPYMKLQCGSLVPLKRVTLLQDPYMQYPSKDKPLKWTLQFHIRGLSVHGDFRIQISKSQAIGWTWDVGKSLTKIMTRHVSDALLSKVGLTKSRIDELSISEISSQLDKSPEGRQLKKQFRERTQKLSLKQLRGLMDELWKDEMEPILANPNRKILTQKKSTMSPEWLEYEAEIPAGAVGATKELEGQLIIVDRGTVELGAQKSYYHEYFLKAKKMGDRRLVVRRIATRKGWGVKESFAWLTFFTKKGERPYVLSKRAIEKKWIPPERVSALPESIRSQIPSNYQYWRAKNARQIRDALVDEIGKKVTLKLQSGLKFAVKRVWHRGPEVRRGLPVTRYWLLIHDGKRVHEAFDFGEGSNPLEAEGITARKRTEPDLKQLLSTTGEIDPGHSASRTKKLKNEFDTSDEGKVKVLVDEADRLQLRLDGGKLKGAYAFIRESPSGQMWVFQKTELSKERKLMLLQAPPSRVIHCGTNDITWEKKGELLILRGPAIKPGEVLPMDARPASFTKQGIKAFWPSMYRQPIVVLHGDLKGDVVGFVNNIRFDENTGWGWVEGVIWHPLGIKLILDGTLGAFSIEVIPETIWDPEHKHDHVIGGRCIGLAVVPKGACPTCTPVDARVGTISDIEGKVYKFGMTIQQYLTHQYYRLGLSTKEISETEGIPRSTIESWMNRFEIPRRDYTEARRLRQLKENEIKILGGRAKITALGTGAFTDICKPGRGESPQCKEAKAGGKSKRNYTATLFSVGNQNLLINAPKGIIGMLGEKKAKPKFVLLEHIHEDVIGGLHELRSLNPVVFATKEIWDWLRRHYRGLSGQSKASFEELYSFDRKILPRGKMIQMGAFRVTPVHVRHAKPGDPSALGFKIEMGKTIWHCSDILDLPDRKEILKDVDIFIGDGASLRRGVITESQGQKIGHTSMEDQITWAQEADIPKIYFTQIGHVGKTHEDLNKELKEMAPNAQALHDGAEITLGGSNPLAAFPEKIAKGIAEGEINVVIRSKPYSEYAKQAILIGDGRQIYALYVEGFPEKMSVGEAKKMNHGLKEKEWKAAVGDAKEVWIYHPRILKRYLPPREMKELEITGPYIYDAQVIQN